MTIYDNFVFYDMTFWQILPNFPTLWRVGGLQYVYKENNYLSKEYIRNIHP